MRHEVFYRGFLLVLIASVAAACSEGSAPSAPPRDGESPEGPDPNEDGVCYENGECWWQAHLVCDGPVDRGTQGECEFWVTPEWVPNWVDLWAFFGEYQDIVVFPNGSYEIVPHRWVGQIVQAGTVSAYYSVNGVPILDPVSADLEVTPRTGSEWTWDWGDEIQYTQGGLTFPQGDTAVAKTCRIEGCGQAIVQPYPASRGNGYELGLVSGGPNHGIYWVESIDFDVLMASAINPEWLPGGTPRVTDQCPGYASLSIWDFNTTPICSGGSPTWGSTFLSWAWAHEDQHAQNLPLFLSQYGTNDLARILEPLSDQYYAGFTTFLDNTLIPMKVECVGDAAATHVGFAGPSFDVWHWSYSAGHFYLWPGGSGPWWPPDPIVESECLN